MSENRYEATPDGSKSGNKLGNRLSNKPYGKELAQLHVEMVKLEEWVVHHHDDHKLT